jgi:hypothetical protein
MINNRTTRAVFAGVILLFVACSGAPPPEFNPDPSENTANDLRVVLLSIDGPRQTETTLDPSHRHIPKLWNELRPQGAFIPNFRNQGTTKTMPGHASLLTGTWQRIKNNGSERPTRPTLFEYYRKHHRVQKRQVQLVSGKGKVGSISYSLADGYGRAFGAATTAGIDNDLAVFDTLVTVLEREQPTLTVVCFPAVDIIGHSGKFDRYLAAIEYVDSLAVECWKYLQSDPFYAGRTYLFITNDHGRHDDEHGGFQHHGDQCDGCERLMFFAVGPHIRPGYVVDETVIYTQRDVATTIAHILDFPAEYSEGKVIGEIFRPDSPLAADE